MKKYIGVYMITNIKTDKVYIGHSTNIKKRFSWHLAKMRKGIHPIKCFNDVGAVKFEILEECSPEELREREDYWINYMSELIKVVNKNKAGKTPYNSDEAKIRKSASQIGSRNGNAKLTESQVKEIKLMLRNNCSNKEIAEKYGISENYVNRIKYGYRWKHVSVE
ncbi:GIY-YIG nuclease family protein [Clostridium thermosuccinogenes]|uniref:GIY-YIG nuclease family protein n=1 Tax=Clostridium thermosuccinogenes TaxID=84032 RepID=UPI000CCC97A3|nr:GIY-YIG nuclease family protein [Pseudoclostridium thermosuccinogenes]PNT94159.1 hypothetical protein CDQ83_11970 [Pseudoclostridium thermosuccinogenes]